MKKTKSTIIYKKWDIVLVPFPFTDLSTTKRRPALIISPNQHNTGNEIVITFITSKLSLKGRMGDHLIIKWSEAKLPKPSLIRMRFATIDKQMIVKKIGRLVLEDIEEFKKQLSAFFIE